MPPYIACSCSPLRRYFDGYISDGQAKIQFIGFSTTEEKSLEEMAKEKQAIVLLNCLVKKVRLSDDFELIVGNSTVILKSNKKFSIDFSEETTDTLKEISLGDVQDQPPYQKMTVNAKIMEIANPFQLEDGRQIQDVVIADATGTAKLSLWENFVHSVMLDKSYKFFNMVIKPFN